ncbi:MAG TPA: RNA 2',3'-cyclic phosphodiesterase [Candidatus Thermoplasmatota archaeon]|nr:RNA 2',3'-cyclic phosphodiesterase [Candidatus Thermoplasmatota archaeon]
MRGFIAVEVGPQPALVLLLEALRATGADLKIVPPENLHVTLKFLGETPDDALSAVGDAMRRAVEGEAPFRMRLRETGSFPPRSSPRVYWVGLAEAEPLRRIAERLDTALEPLGWPRERRPFAAHMTVARARSSAGSDRARAAMERTDVSGDVDVRRILLFRSELSRAGPKYTPRLDVPLGGGA